MQLLIASETASQVDSVEELEQFREEGGMPRLLMALSPTPYTTKVPHVSKRYNYFPSLSLNRMPLGLVECLHRLTRI